MSLWLITYAAAYRAWILAEDQILNSWRVEAEHPRQVLTLMAIDQRHAVATEREFALST